MSVAATLRRIRVSSMLAIALALSFIVASATRAQTCAYFPDSTAAGTGNLIPFGAVSPSDASWSNQKYQTLIPAATLGVVPGNICELAFVSTVPGTRQFASIRIQLAQTMATTLSATFASNIGSNARTVLDARDYYWTNVPNQWNRIGLQNPYLYLPTLGNLVVDIEVRGAGMPNSPVRAVGFASAKVFRLYAFGWTTTPPATGSSDSLAGLKIEACFDTHDAWTFGAGCTGSSNTAPQLGYSGSAKLGATLHADLGGALALKPVLLLLGFTNATPFPIDLGPIGAPGCSLYTSPDVVITTVSNGAGNASVAMPIPNDQRLVCARIYNQFLPFDPQANALGLSASNYGRALLGN